MKRWIAMLLTVCMLISLCPVGVFAEPATGGTEPAQTVQTEQSATGATGVEPAANPVAVPKTEKPTNPVADTKAAEPTAETGYRAHYGNQGYGTHRRDQGYRAYYGNQGHGA